MQQPPAHIKIARQGFPAKAIKFEVFPGGLTEVKRAEFRYASGFIAGNFVRIFPFLPPEYRASMEHVDYLNDLTLRIYPFALYPFSTAYVCPLQWGQFQFNVRYFATVRYGETWLCDNMYYRFRDSFMMPLIVRQATPEKENITNSNIPKFYIQNKYTDCFAQYELIMRTLHRINSKRYLATFYHTFVNYDADLAHYSFALFDQMLKGMPLLDHYKEDDDWFTAVLEYFGPLLKWDDVPANSAFYITKLPMHECVSPIMTTALKWKDLLADYAPEDCFVLSCML